MDLTRGSIYWTNLGEAKGSRPAFRRPVLIIQDNIYNESQLATVIVLSLTINQTLARLRGNVFIQKEESGLPQDFVINVTQIVTLNKADLDTHVSQLPEWLMSLVDDGLKRVMGL